MLKLIFADEIEYGIYILKPKNLQIVRIIEFGIVARYKGIIHKSTSIYVPDLYY